MTRQHHCRASRRDVGEGACRGAEHPPLTASPKSNHSPVALRSRRIKHPSALLGKLPEKQLPPSPRSPPGLYGKAPAPPRTGKRAFITERKETETHGEPEPSLRASSEEQIKQLTSSRTADGMGSPHRNPPGMAEGLWFRFGTAWEGSGTLEHVAGHSGARKPRSEGEKN